MKAEKKKNFLMEMASFSLIPQKSSNKEENMKKEILEQNLCVSCGV